ncbi:MinD-like ATPase involved in chromosome partitioning or flagellar assembly [Marinobacter sp. LV10R510-11A]|uniref:MinD/ParA family ATP-binding protein n=1 Tax=Marinobacter sp. LV10R510-11A TaxID=1415568 RepID=UPI000BB8D4E4|nr:AAA family ATPase [Marinobacter sp. LV10R510-11A]SOB76374.1 MinD-like ATPase involved in chromosome partitioning or flagellar assembly [Marinobacter sp. LV10R510-11A]
MSAKESRVHKVSSPRTIAVTGGKGGVGKTSIALNLALTLARHQKRVLLLDGDTDLANVSIMLGLYPERTLANVIAGECRLEDILLEADYGLHILPGASGVQECMDMEPEESFGILRALSILERRYDYVITDTAAGLQPAGMHMIAAAELACVVVTPDPASLTDAFSLIKVLKRRGYRRTPSVLINMAQGASQARSVFQRLDSAARRHLQCSLHYMGGVWRDETLRQSVLNQKPVALLPESDPSCRQFLTLADMLDVRLSQLPPRKAGIAAYWHSVSKRQPGRTHKTDVAPAVASPRERCLQAVGELESVFEQTTESALLRYDVFIRLFALLGRTPDNDTIEIIQTGLGAIAWESLNPELREHLAAHLRHLADEISLQTVLPEPFYDRIRFGDQKKLIRALKEQPSDVSLSQLLRSLTGIENNDR